MNSRPKFQAWQAPPITGVSDSQCAKQIASLYEQGFSGVGLDPEEREASIADFEASMPHPDGEAVCHEFGFADAAANQLVPTWEIVERLYPGCWPARPQAQGDCVSMSGRNARLTTLCGEVVAGLPDEVSGKREEAPKVSPEAQRDGVLATEPHYRHRGHRSHGWFCSADAKVGCTKAGAVLRAKYGDVDLTSYNPRWAAGSAKSDEVETFGRNLFREATRVSSFEAIRDLLSRGFGISSCGGEGFSKTRDENGVSKRSGRWAHAMAYIGADERPVVVRKYGTPLVLVLNSWGPSWNRGPRTVMGTDKEIPRGSFWAKWTDISRRDCYAFAGLDGWERETILDYVPVF